MWLVRVTTPVKKDDATVLYYWIETPFRDEAIDIAKECASVPDVVVKAICGTEIDNLKGRNVCNEGATAIRGQGRGHFRPVRQENFTAASRNIT
jgi:hypothetical protein